MRAARELDWFALVDRLRVGVNDTNAELRQRRLEKLYIIAAHEADVKFKITEPTFWRHRDRQPGEVLEDAVGPYRHAPGAGGLVHVAQFEELTAVLPSQRQQVNTVESPLIARVKAKAQQARAVAPKAIADFEADLDGLIAEGPKLESERVEAVSMHKDVVTGVRGEFQGLREAMGILSNGGPALDPLHDAEQK